MTALIAKKFDSFEGDLIYPGHPDYDHLRRIWNRMIDRRPALIARCTSAQDVVAVLAFARREGLEIAVRGGGHSMPGHSIRDDAIVVDLAPINHARVDATARRAWVGGGCVLRQVDQATQAHGLIVPAGAVSHTGLGGLVLGGGFGHVMRRYGLSIDSLISAEVVLANGAIVRASESEHTDLFWALRGGGGNFGVVTEFEFALHPQKTILIGNAFHLPDNALDALRRWRDSAYDAPDDLNWMSFFRFAPRLPWVPDHLVDRPGIISMIEWAGDQEKGEKVVSDLLQKIGGQAKTMLALPYLTLQSAFDEVQASGNHAYAKAGFIDDLTDAALGALIEHGARIPSWRSQLEVMPLGGAVARVDRESTAFAHRDARWIFNVVSVWEDSAKSDANVAWARESYDALAPFATGGAYVNYMGGEELGGSEAAFGSAIDRLSAIKAVYDPENVFRATQNIPPPQRPRTYSAGVPATEGVGR